MNDAESNLSIDAEVDDDGTISDDGSKLVEVASVSGVDRGSGPSVSVTSFEDGQAVQLEDGTTAYIYRKLKEGMDNQLIQAIDLEDGTTAYIHHSGTSCAGSQPELAIDEDKSIQAYKCDEDGCGKFYSSSHHLRVHKRSHTGERPFVCQWKDCGKSFSTSYALKSHLRVHTGEKPYVCTHAGCIKAFKTAGDLQKHTRIHTGEKPFKCPFDGCGKAFTTSNICKVHTRTHTGERPYKCPFPDCDKAFSTATNYKNHVRIHTGEKPFACEVPGCGKRFTEYSSFYKHQVVHADRNAYCCQHCGKYYAYTSTLLVHKKTVHDDESSVQSSEILIERRKPAKQQNNSKQTPGSQYNITNVQMQGLNDKKIPTTAKKTTSVDAQRMLLLPVTTLQPQAVVRTQANSTAQMAAVVASGAGQQLAIISHDGCTQQFTLALTDQGSTILLPASDATNSTGSPTKADNVVLFSDNTLQRMEASETNSTAAEPTPINADIWLHQPQKEDINAIPDVKETSLKNYVKEEENIPIQFESPNIPCDDTSSSDSIAYLEIGGAKYQLKIVAAENDTVDQINVDESPANDTFSSPVTAKHLNAIWSEKSTPRTGLGPSFADDVDGVGAGNLEKVKDDAKLGDINFLTNRLTEFQGTDEDGGSGQIDVSQYDTIPNVRLVLDKAQTNPGVRNAGFLPVVKKRKL